MPTRVSKVQRKVNRIIPKINHNSGRVMEEAQLNPPGTNLGETMPKPDSKGKVPAEESGELIVWDNRQRY